MGITIIRAEALCVHAQGRPAPKGSQIAMKTKDGRPYTRAASKYEAPWVNAVRDATRNAMRHATPVDAPYRVELVFHLHRPKRPSQPWPTAHDLDKLCRAAIDGLVRGGAISDDRHVTVLLACKQFVDDPELEGMTAYVENSSDR